MNCADCKLNNACYQGMSCYDRGYRQPEYDIEENRRILTIASRLEAEYYMKIPRLQELILFSQEMGFTRLGIGFCVGLSKEAKEIADILKKHFEVHSVCCKVC